MKLFIIQSSLVSRHFLNLRLKYSPQNPVLNQTYSMFHTRDLTQTKFNSNRFVERHLFLLSLFFILLY